MSLQGVGGAIARRNTPHAAQWGASSGALAPHRQHVTQQGPWPAWIRTPMNIPQCFTAQHTRRSKVTLVPQRSQNLASWRFRRWHLEQDHMLPSAGPPEGAPPPPRSTCSNTNR